MTGEPPTPIGEPCWSTIGVWGRDEPRCAELARAVHCRNCPVYQAAGRRLLDREPPPGYGADWMDGLSDQLTDERKERQPALVFRAGGELLALRLGAIVEVTEWRPIRTIPHGRDPVLLGLTNVGGELHLCVSLEALFGGPRPQLVPPPPRGRLIVIGQGSRDWVVPVEEALSAAQVPIEHLEAAPATVQRSSQAFLRGLFRWRDELVGLLDDELVLGALGRRMA